MMDGRVQVTTRVTLGRAWSAEAPCSARCGQRGHEPRCNEGVEVGEVEAHVVTELDKADPALSDEAAHEAHRYAEPQGGRRGIEQSRGRSSG